MLNSIEFWLIISRWFSLLDIRFSSIFVIFKWFNLFYFECFWCATLETYLFIRFRNAATYQIHLDFVNTNLNLSVRNKQNKITLTIYRVFRFTWRIIKWELSLSLTKTHYIKYSANLVCLPDETSFIIIIKSSLPRFGSISNSSLQIRKSKIHFVKLFILIQLFIDAVMIIWIHMNRKYCLYC